MKNPNANMELIFETTKHYRLFFKKKSLQHKNTPYRTQLYFFLTTIQV